MLLFLSPAKSLDFKTPPQVATFTQPAWLERSATLIRQLRALSPADIANLMDLSDPLALLNFNRYADWSLPFTPENAKQAALAFDGDVYDGLAAKTLAAADLDFAQRHVRILSGLYGMLKPLDLIQPYRLEMGSKLANPKGADLYAFWGARIARALNAAGAEAGTDTLVNCASNEYFHAVDRKALKLRVITPAFYEVKAGEPKIVSFFAKKARGAMARFIAENRLTDPQDLKAFAIGGYAFDAARSGDGTLVFLREAVADQAA